MAVYCVTGCAGFVGSNIVAKLLAQGETVRGIDNFVTGKRDNLEDLQGLEFVEGDITDPSVLQPLFRGVDFVLHQAAIPSVPRSVQDPMRTHHANVNGTLTVFESARHASVKRVVYASSSSIYGNTPELPKHEDLPPRPMSPYAVSKLAGEYYGKVYTQLYNTPVVSLRYFNVFGPRQNPRSEYAAVIPKFICATQCGDPITVHGDGTQSRDFTFIDNVVRANLLACSVNDAPGHVFNIAFGERHTLNALIDKIASVVGKRVPCNHQEARVGDVLHSGADIRRAQSLLGYAPAFDLDAGLAQTAAWFARH